LAAEVDGPHLILVGLPGAGKSGVGKYLARRLGRRFMDFDVEIARREGKSVAAIFAQHGEAHFRELEHALTAELRSVAGMVLAPGGGWVTRPGTVALLRPPARLAYLEVTPATAVRRMGTGVANRPLLQGSDPVGELDRLLRARQRAYEEADFVVNVERLTLQQVGAKLLTALR
jgi:shikimate kinase